MAITFIAGNGEVSGQAPGPPPSAFRAAPQALPPRLSPGIPYWCRVQTAHVIGAGGIGVALGWSLARGGWDVTMVDADSRKLDAGRKDGISVDGVSERRLRFSAFADWTPPESAVVLLCTKTYDNAPVLARLASRRWLVPVQNGFDPMLDASGHPCEGIASFVSQCERGRPATRITRPGELHLGGRRDLAAEERGVLQSLAAGLRRGGWKQIRLVARIGPYKFAKLMYNAAISPLAAAAGVDNGQLLSDPLAQRLFFALLRENYAILRRRGVPLARIGPFPPWLVNRILSLPGLARSLARLFRPGLRGTYCSMAPDIGTGRTEIPAYNGYLKSLAQEADCPINTAVLELIGTMHARSLSPDRQRLVELRAALGMEGAS